MNYAEAVKFCREHEIYKDEKTQTFFEFGDVRATILILLAFELASTAVFLFHFILFFFFFFVCVLIAVCRTSPRDLSGR
jgi:hypothetical protein